jgi:uncharacterized protein YecE (DUF72 family)
VWISILKKELHIGMSGWSYGDWKGVFYPEGIASKDQLTYYAESFDCTEINSTFYHLPRAATTAGWMEKVPEQFMFCPKMHRSITHIQKLKDTKEPLQRFFKAIAPLQQQLGPVLIQLPPSLKYDEPLVSSFLDLLTQQYSEYSFALEARHLSWTEPEPLAMLSAHKVSWVIAQSGAGYPYLEAVTAKNVYLRMHGPGKLYSSSYPKAMIEVYAAKIIKWIDAGHNVWVFFNNTMKGVAIANARTLIELINNQ